MVSMFASSAVDDGIMVSMLASSAVDDGIMVSMLASSGVDQVLVVSNLRLYWYLQFLCEACSIKENQQKLVGLESG